MRIVAVFMLGMSLLVGTGANAANREVLLRDIGVIGLLSHDLFAWDRKTQTNKENSQLDLSTIFDYEGGWRWWLGGAPKNSQNPIVYTFTKEILDYFIWRQEFYEGEAEAFDKARADTIEYFLKEIDKSLTRVFGEGLPEYGLSGNVTNEEQAAFRALHDLLPGRVKLFRSFGADSLDVTSPWKRKFRFNKAEFNQVLPYFDGKYDEEYLDINMLVFRLDLQEVDRKFIVKYSNFELSEMLQELKAFGDGSRSFNELSFSTQLRNLVAKGLCVEDSRWENSRNFSCN